MKVSPTTAAIVNGEDDLSTWSAEELERGQRRDKNGNWPTKRPTIIARAVHDELIKRKMRKAYDLLRENTYKAVEVLVEVATDKETEPSVRVKAAELILDRSLGKVTERMQLDVDLSPFQRLVATAIVGTEEQAREIASGSIEEGEILDDTAEEEEEEEWIQEDERKRRAERFVWREGDIEIESAAKEDSDGR